MNIRTPQTKELAYLAKLAAKPRAFAPTHSMLATSSEGKTALVMNTAEVLQRVAARAPHPPPYARGENPGEWDQALFSSYEEYAELARAWGMVCRWLDTFPPKQRAALKRFDRDSIAYSRGERDAMPHLEDYGL